jgi:hypothetical protein
MRKLLACLVVLASLTIVAAPAAAHHGHGHHQDDSNQSPGSREEWTDWCKQVRGPGRGECVANHVRALGLEVLLLDDDNDNDGNDNGDNDNEQGDLRITKVDVDDDGSFRVRGQGAEGPVLIWVGGFFSRVLGFGQGEANGDGEFDIEGAWGCRTDDDPHLARVRVRDEDERHRQLVSFPCDDRD